MKNSLVGSTLEEIRKSQNEIAQAMNNDNIAKSEQQTLERASLHLRNMERMLAASVEKAMISSLKQESIGLLALCAQMDIRIEAFARISGTLHRVVSATGQLIDLIDLVR